MRWATASDIKAINKSLKHTPLKPPKVIKGSQQIDVTNLFEPAVLAGAASDTAVKAVRASWLARGEGLL